MKATYLIICAILVVLATASVGLADVSAGLVAYYPFNGNANDESGNGNHGTVTGATLTSDRFGNANSAYYFDGVDDWIGTSADNLPTGERTVSVWFNLDTVANRPILLGYGGGGPGPPGTSWLEGVNIMGQPNFSVQSHWTTNLLNYNYGSDEPVGDWYNYIVTTSAAGTRIYINGQLKASNTNFINNTIVPGTDLAMGAEVSTGGVAPYTDGNGGYLKGVLDDVRFYNRALSLSEIQELADLSPGLVAYYPFNGNANDESGNGNHGTVTGATLTSDRFGNANSAYYFDGVDDWIGASADNLPIGERTVSLWFNIDTVANRPILLGYGGGGPGPPGTSWLEGINIEGKPSFSVQSHWRTNLLDYYYSEEPVGGWYNYIVTTSAAGTEIYINGQLEASNTNFINNTIVPGTDLAMGAEVSTGGVAPYTDGNAGYLKGVLDDVRIYDRALSLSEIQEIQGFVLVVVPVADAGEDQIVAVGDTVSLDGTGSSDPDPGPGPLSFNWTLESAPEASSATLADSAAAQTSFTADVAGTYVVSLVVNDGTEDSEPDTVTITAVVCPSGVTGLDVGGALYDVTFTYGPFVDVWPDGCPGPTFWTPDDWSYGPAMAAAIPLADALTDLGAECITTASGGGGTWQYVLIPFITYEDMVYFNPVEYIPSLESWFVMAPSSCGGITSPYFWAVFTLLNTPPGTNVEVILEDSQTGTSPVTLMFPEVTELGSTSLTIYNSAPSIPSGFQVGSPATYFDISTTASYNGLIEICIDYRSIDFTGPPRQLRLIHYDDAFGDWVDCTTAVYPASKTICGEVTSLSPFAVLADVEAPTINSISASPDVLWPANHKMVEVVVTVEAEDNSGQTPMGIIVDVECNESENGQGDGNTEPDSEWDWEYTDDPLVVLLRSESAGVGIGREYAITVACRDAAGNVSDSRTVKVFVPHDQGKGGKKK